MKERPILFSAPMVRALLDGSKTQTRRIVKPEPSPYWNPSVGTYNPTIIKNGGYEAAGPEIFGASDETEGRKCPYGQPGDRLWVRETFSDVYGSGGDERRRKQEVMYRANGETDLYVIGGRWTPSIHMPRWASRILLEIMSVRVERLNDISEEDARAEGITDGGCINCGEPEPCGCTMTTPDARDSYCHLWGQINGHDSWTANPWVWCVTFRRIQP